MTKTKRNEIVSQLVDILGPLTTKERSVVLVELVGYRKHWFAAIGIQDPIETAAADSHRERIPTKSLP